jgi:hypothetical protein
MKYKRIVGFFLVVIVVASLWFISKYKDVYKEEVVFNISFIDVPNNLTLDTSSQQINMPVEIRASGFILIWEKIFGEHLELDFKDHTYLRNDTLLFNPSKSIKKINKSKKISFEVLSADDVDIPIQFKRFLSKKVPVVNQIELDYTLNYLAIKKPYFQKDSVTITGNDAKVNALNELVIVRDSKLVIKDTLTTLEIDLKEIDVNLNFEPQKLTLSVEATQMTEGKVDIPVRLLNAPTAYDVKLIPDNVQLVYSTAVSNFDQIKARDFSISIDYNLIQELNIAVVPVVELRNDKVVSYRINPKQVQVLTIK